MFNMCLLLGKQTPPLSLRRLSRLLKKEFGSDRTFSIKQSTQPFIGAVLHLRWGDWSIMVVYEDDEEVLNDAKAIKKALTGKLDLESVDWTRRLRVVVSSDPTREHTEEILQVMDFLSLLKDVTLFDPQRMCISVMGNPPEASIESSPLRRTTRRSRRR